MPSLLRIYDIDDKTFHRKACESISVARSNYTKTRFRVSDYFKPNSKIPNYFPTIKHV